MDAPPEPGRIQSCDPHLGLGLPTPRTEGTLGLSGKGWWHPAHPPPRQVPLVPLGGGWSLAPPSSWGHGEVREGAAWGFHQRQGGLVCGEGGGQEQAQLTPRLGSPAAPGAVPLAPASGLVGTRTRPPVTGYTHDQEGALKAFTNSGQGLAGWKGQGPSGDQYCQLFLHFT